jgi:3-hydroxybutyryl-CoA dehydrogenase
MRIEGIEEIVVIGGGQMGNGIAQVTSQAGFRVTIVDVSDEILERSLENIESSLARLVKAGKTSSEDADAARGRLSTTTDVDAAARAADHVIEAVIEDIGVKKELFRRIDELCAPEVILATNTSQFSITEIASATERPDRVIGTHWFNPPAVMRLIEIVRGLATSDETLEATLALAHAYGKETIVCKRDVQGFLTARLAMALNLEAVRCLEEGIADVDDINRACVLGFNHAMGPLDTFDLGGLDTAVRSADAMTARYGDRFRAPELLRTLVSAGHFGRKTGRGFRTYGD